MNTEKSLHPEMIHYSAPLGELKLGRLVFVSGASQVRLTAVQMEDDLYRASFREPAPSLWLHDNTLSIHFHHRLSIGRRLLSKALQAEILLNAAIPWEIEVRGGAADFSADLRGVQVRSLDILGGASHLDLILPEPDGTTFVYISEGVSNSLIRRPPSAGARLRIHGGSTRLQFDERSYDALAGETNLESGNYHNAVGRYDIRIAGGTSQLSVIEKV